jgi:hypothetical protein
MGVLASDNFNRANANPIGAPWTTASGVSAMQIVSNAATASSLAADCGADYTGITWPADQYSKAKLSVTGTGGAGQGACLSVRSASGARTLYRLEVDHAATLNVAVEKFVAGTPSALIGPLTQAWTDGDTWEIRAQGPTISVYRNGALVGAATDISSPLLTGNPGIGYSSVETAASIDDWEGGTIDAPLLPVVDKPLTLLRCTPLGPSNPLREVKYYDVPSASAPGVTVAPDVGLLVLDGFAPTIGTPVTILPGAGALTLNGFAPSVGTPITIRPDFGQLTLTGFAPSIGTPVTLRPALGQLILTGFSPTIGTPVTLLPGLGQLTLSGFAPVIGTPITLRPGLGQLVLNGFAPSITVVAGAINMQPGFGALVLTGFAPTIGTPVTVRPGLGALLLSGFAPSVGTPVTLRPGLGQLVLAGFNPTLTLTSLTGTSDFTGELSVDPRFTGDADIAPYFSGVLRTAAQFSGVVSIAARFSGMLLITPWFDGEEEVGPG